MELVSRAWSELAAMKLSEGLATIDAIQAECEPLPMASIDLPCASAAGRVDGAERQRRGGCGTGRERLERSRRPAALTPRHRS